MKKQYQLYYTFLALIVFGMALHTVFVGSRHVDYGRRVAVLQEQKRRLSAQLTQVDQLKAQAVAMTSLNDDARNQGFVPIHNIVRVDTSTVVASR